MRQSARGLASIRIAHRNTEGLVQAGLRTRKIEGVEDETFPADRLPAVTRSGLMIRRNLLTVAGAVSE
jgi:hypothetical protein